MLKGAIARRYAGAMFEIGLKQNKLDRTLEDVKEIAQVYANRKLAYLLREPKIPAQRKETAIHRALVDKVLPSSLNLALLVVQRRLTDLMPNIGGELEKLVLNYKNQAIAQVTTATKLDDAQMNLIKQALERRTGKTILVETKVQPEILGGVITRIGDQVIDGSIRYRLSALRQRLLSGSPSSSIDFLSEAGNDQGKKTTAEDALVTPNSQGDTAEPSRIQ